MEENPEHIDPNPDENAGGTPDNQETPTAFSQADIDRAVQQGIATFTKNHAEKIAQEARQKIEAELEEAEKLKKLTAEEREKFESDKEKAKFDAERADFQRERLTFETVKELAKHGLEEDFAEFCVADTAESTLERVKKLAESIDAKVKSATEKQVEERLGNGFVPKTATNISGLTLDAFQKMTVSQQMEIYETNRALYDALISEYKGV